MPENALYLNFKRPAPKICPLQDEADENLAPADFPRTRIDLRGARGWFLLSVASLLLAGFFAAFLVIGRIPVVAPYITDAGFFKRCLVVHVNLSLLVWFGAFSAGLFRLLPDRDSSKSIFRGIPLLLAIVGVALIMVSAFLPGATPILSNYVPFIDHPLFALGFIFFISGLALNFLQPRLWSTELMTADDFIPPDVASGIRVSALAALVATVTFAVSRLATPDGLTPEVFYELIAWGGGHVLQVANVAAMVAIWLFLIHRLQRRPVVSPAITSLLSGLLLIPHMFAPLLTLRGTTDSLYHHGSTQLMRWGIFPVVSVFLILCIRRILEAKKNRRLPADFWKNIRFIGFSLSAAMTLFGFILGAMIRGSNTMVPAHYHAAIGAVTVAFMAMAYLLLQPFGRRIRSARWRKLIPWQLAAFGIGQLIFALGFAIGGAYGLDRKAYSDEQYVASLGEHIGLGVMGIGGLVAMTGGLLFLTLMIVAWRPRRSHKLSTQKLTHSATHGS